MYFIACLLYDYDGQVHDQVKTQTERMTLRLRLKDDVCCWVELMMRWITRARDGICTIQTEAQRLIFLLLFDWFRVCVCMHFLWWNNLILLMGVFHFCTRSNGMHCTFAIAIWRAIIIKLGGNFDKIYVLYHYRLCAQQQNVLFATRKHSKSCSCHLSIWTLHRRNFRQLELIPLMYDVQSEQQPPLTE